ncbi:MAG: hypothetical protein JW940_00560 [Polyangiaceae bacterium]|nr:hypothetical protein [Polyangiaceae bacterium]
MIPPDARPMIQVLRSDCILKLYRDGDSYTLQVSRLRKAPKTLEKLTAEQALTELAQEMDGGGHG